MNCDKIDFILKFFFASLWLLSQDVVFDSSNDAASVQLYLHGNSKFSSCRPREKRLSPATPVVDPYHGN